MTFKLRFRLVGPMQSWGTRSRFDHRDSGLAPSKSGVLGMVAAALGRPRSGSVKDLAALRFGVRIDQEGQLGEDFHTAQDVIVADQSKRLPTAVTRRAYLADAAFLCGLESPQRDLLDEIAAALVDPHWPLALGRRAFVPSQPVALHPPHDPEPIVPVRLEQALAECSPLVRLNGGGVVRYVLEDIGGTEEWFDQPLDDFQARTFGVRRVRVVTADWGAPCT